MSWSPITLAELHDLLAADLKNCPPEWVALFERTRVEPQKWELPPWGDEGGGFWVVAMSDDLVLWYNDIEDGFNVSPFVQPGRIGEYWCNQDELCRALRFLERNPGPSSGAPLPLDL